MVMERAPSGTQLVQHVYIGDQEASLFQRANAIECENEVLLCNADIVADVRLRVAALIHQVLARNQLRASALTTDAYQDSLLDRPQTWSRAPTISSLPASSPDRMNLRRRDGLLGQHRSRYLQQSISLYIMLCCFKVHGNGRDDRREAAVRASFEAQAEGDLLLHADVDGPSLITFMQDEPQEDHALEAAWPLRSPRMREALASEVPPDLCALVINRCAAVKKNPDSRLWPMTPASRPRGRALPTRGTPR